MSLVLSAGMQETVPLPAPLGLICRTYQAVTAKDKQGACTDGNVLSHLVWAMYGLCMSDAWAVSVAWYERKANKRESAIPYQKQMFLSIVQHLHCCQDWWVPCSGTPCCLRQPHLQFIPPSSGQSEHPELVWTCSIYISFLWLLLLRTGLLPQTPHLRLISTTGFLAVLEVKCFKSCARRQCFHFLEPSGT